MFPLEKENLNLLVNCHDELLNCGLESSNGRPPTGGGSTTSKSQFQRQGTDRQRQSRSEWDQTPRTSSSRAPTPSRRDWTGRSQSNSSSWDKETPRRNGAQQDEVVDPEAWDSEQTRIDRDWYNMEDNTVRFKSIEIDR